jgi:hypothetical protein
MAYVALQIEIEGIGLVDAGGAPARWVWTSDPSDTTPGRRAWYPVDELPRIAGASLPTTGGCFRQGELSFALVDVEGELTRQLAVRSPPLAVLVEPLTLTGTTITLDTGASGVPQLCAIGTEMVRVVSTSGTTATVQRGVLGTRARAHPIGSVVTPRLTHISGRRVDLYSVVDGVRTTLGSWWLDNVSLSHGMQAWSFACRSRDRYLDRMALLKPWRASCVPSNEALPVSLPPELRAHPRWALGRIVHVRIGDSIAEVRVDDGRLRIIGHGLYGSKPLDTAAWAEPDHGPVDVEEVIVSGDIIGSRWDAERVYWEPITSAAEVVMCLLLGGEPRGDANGDSTIGWYGGLSHGAGIPWEDVDVASWSAARERLASTPIDALVLDSTSGTVRDVVDGIAQYTGLAIGYRGGKLHFRDVSPDINPSVTVSLADVLTTETSTMVRALDVSEPMLDSSRVYTRIDFTCRDRRGQDRVTSLRMADVEGSVGATMGAAYGDEYALEIDARHVLVSSDDHIPEAIMRRAASLLSSHQHPTWTMSVGLDIALWLGGRLGVGDTIILDHPLLPDSITGERGTVGAEWVITDEHIDVLGGVVRYGLVQRMYPPIIVGRIAPSATIMQVSGSWAYVASNAYTIAENGSGWPTRDSKAFRIGDRVVVTSARGVVLSAVLTIVDIVPGSPYDRLVLSASGTFNAPGNIIELAAATDQNAAVLERAAFIADASTRLIISPSGARPAWRLR